MLATDLRWRYRTFKEYSLEGVIERLDEHGAKGWELTAIVPENISGPVMAYTFVLKQCYYPSSFTVPGRTFTAGSR